jgi:hypothetical protein
MNHLPPAIIIQVALFRYFVLKNLQRYLQLKVHHWYTWYTTGGKFTVDVNVTGGDIFPEFTLVVVTTAAFRIE